MSELHIQYPWNDTDSIQCFVHETSYYRYHWHPSEYEISILLTGSQEFCFANQTTSVREHDVILVNPDTGHGSFGQHPGTLAAVLHIPVSAFTPFVRQGYRLEFEAAGDSQSNDSGFRLIRHYVGLILQSSELEEPIRSLQIHAAMEMLLVVLYTQFPHKEVELAQGNTDQLEVIRNISEYMDQHYAEKLTLQDLTEVVQYNRTYISTLFKNTLGINFHEHLTRIRFQHALTDLATTDKNFTSIALDNGFSDLKSFNKLFKSILHETPAQYREKLGSQPLQALPGLRKYVDSENEYVQELLKKLIHE